MEYVDGEDLKGMIRMMGHLSDGKAISIAKQVCEGSSEAHRTGVVHRDLKPSNIMIDREGNVKIMDFGIARSLSGKGITGVGVMIGTPDYNPVIRIGIIIVFVITVEYSVAKRCCENCAGSRDAF